MTTGINGIEVARDTATVLLHVALADGNADADELARIQAGVSHQSRQHGIEAPAVDAGSITEESVNGALGRLAGMSRGFKADLVNHATIIADVDGSVDASEIATIGKIANGLFDGEDADTAIWLANAKMMVRKAEQKLGLYGSM